MEARSRVHIKDDEGICEGIGNENGEEGMPLSDRPLGIVTG